MSIPKPSALEILCDLIIYLLAIIPIGLYELSISTCTFVPSGLRVDIGTYKCILGSPFASVATFITGIAEVYALLGIFIFIILILPIVFSIKLKHNRYTTSPKSENWRFLYSAPALFAYLIILFIVLIKVARG